MSEFLNTIRERRSVRHFRPDPVANDLIEQLLEAACWAPSAGNLQPWEFFVVTNPSIRADLASAAFQRFVAEAPVVITVCCLPQKSSSRYGKRGEDLYVLQDSAAAIQNLLLTATALGLGACWVGAFREELVSQVLGLRFDVRPIAMIPVGYPAVQPQPTPRSPARSVTHWI